MAWNFNFCSPHLNDDEFVNLNRTFLVVQLLIGALLTFIVHMLAELYDEESNKVKNEAEENDEEKERNLEESAYSFQKSQEKSNMEILELKKAKKISFLVNEDEEENIGFFRKNKSFFLSVDTVENRAPCFFGHFSIILCACIMYSPFIYQTVMGLIYLIMMVLMLIFQAWKYPRSLKLVVGVAYCMNLGMASSVVVGVGLSNWDQFKISCYYTFLNM